MEFFAAEIKEYWIEMFPSGWFWCLHCERVFNLEKHRREHRPRNECICGAFMAIEGFDWTYIRNENPELPEIPVHGDTYH
jgi:hypothetical protein